MAEYPNSRMLDLTLEFGMTILILIWIGWDTTRKNMDRKYHWGWLIGIVIAYLLFVLLGVLVVAGIYFIWSRFYYKRDNNPKI